MDDHLATERHVGLHLPFTVITVLPKNGKNDRSSSDSWKTCGVARQSYFIFTLSEKSSLKRWFGHFGNHWYHFYWFYCFSLDIKLYVRLFSRTCLSQRFSSFFENPMELRGGASIFPPKIAFVCFQLFLHSSGLFGGDAERESIRYKVNSENTICCFFFCLEGLGDSFVSYYRFHSRTFIIMVKMKRTMSVCHIPWIIARPLYVTARKNVYRRWVKKAPPTHQGMHPVLWPNLLILVQLRQWQSHSVYFFCLKSNCNLKLILKHANSDDKDQRTSCKRDFILLWFIEGWQLAEGWHWSGSGGFIRQCCWEGTLNFDLQWCATDTVSIYILQDYLCIDAGFGKS